MASVYTNDLRLEEIGSGEQSGSWGDTTNTNLELIAEAFAFGTEAIPTNVNNSTHTTTIADGASDPGRAMFLKYTGSQNANVTVTIGPNTVSKLWFIENATTGSSVSLIIKQGSGAAITIPHGDTKAIYSNGAGSGAAMVDAFASLSVVDLKVQDDLTVTDDVSIGGILGVTGVLTTTAATVSNGGGQFNGTVTVGVDDTGYDVKFFGDTASAFMLWDASADDLILGGAAGLSVNSAALVTGVLTTTAAAVFNGGFTSNGGNAIFNEAGAAVDFRIESEDNEQIFIVDGDKNAIGINATDLPTDLPLTIMNSAHRTDFSLVALGIGGTEADDAVGVKSSIGFGFVSAARPIMPAVISYETKSTSGGTFGDLVFGTRPDVGNTQPTVRMTIKSDGKIGIATAAPAAPLQVDTDNGFPALVLSRDGGVSGRRPFGVAIGGNNDASMFINASNDTTGAGAFGSSRVVLMELEAAGDVNVKTGNLVIGTAGKGIDFAAQTSANSVSGVSTTAELLDHYEEGTWTPTCPTASTDLTGTSGRYTRIGREVFISCSVTVPTTSSGAAFLIAGFPFASIAGAPHAGFYMRYTNGGTYRMFFMTASAQSCEMYSLNGDATVLSAVSTKRFDFSGSYQV